MKYPKKIIEPTKVKKLLIFKISTFQINDEQKNMKNNSKSINKNDPSQ
jgi:hypothetical protein